MARTSRDGHVQERRVVEFRLVGEDVRVGVRCDGEVPLATNSPIRAHGIPPRWRSEMRRWRRSCGDHSGLPPPTRSRNRRPQRVGSGPWNTTAVVQFVRQGRRNPRFESRLQATRRRTINRDEDIACSPMGNASDADLGNRPDSVESYPDPDLASMREQLERSSRRPNHESFEINACRASGTCSVLANRDRERIRNFPRRLIVDTSSQYDGSTQDKSDTSHSAHSTNRLPLRLSAVAASRTPRTASHDPALLRTYGTSDGGTRPL